jgi:site-specific recombinase XerC
MALVRMITWRCDTLAIKPKGAPSMQVTGKKTGNAMTWQFYQTMFRDELEATNAAPRTIETYTLATGQLVDFLASVGMPTDPTRVTREHLIEWMRYLQRPVEQGGKGATAATANQRYRSISRFFKFLVEQGEIRETPLAKMHPPKVPEKLVPVVHEQDLKRLLKTLSGADFESRRDRAIFSLFIDCGLRVSEMAALNFDDVDLEDREIVVHQGKGRKPRRLRFTRETRQDIQRYLLRRKDHPYAEHAAIWVGKRGRVTKSGVYRLVVRRCEQAGLGHVHPHALRHTLAHLYRLAGGDDDSLMKVMGWKSREMLHRYGASVAEQRAAELHDQFSPRRGL